MERAERDRAAADERGPPPEPSRAFRLPAALLPDLLATWELLQLLAPTLQVRAYKASLSACQPHLALSSCDLRALLPPMALDSCTIE